MTIKIVNKTNKVVERRNFMVTFAMTIAKVCGVTVEDVFYLQEEKENG